MRPSFTRRSALGEVSRRRSFLLTSTYVFIIQISSSRPHPREDHLWPICMSDANSNVTLGLACATGTLQGLFPAIRNGREPVAVPKSQHNRPV
ncbi:hypothetical protein K469DRAFT_225906 [Zopfia rhizophila CBS 207.26]|uniref:Uncharacterized protein n=1 Tax=Zopfia rhizophila CBS 207.26 TaxID=1314779 RepID=A0A6A6DWF9_9PEZI|nr:hypothetical protein K469DRAFT_225906 [Zopfia rhizophila CBS 207.26]